MVWKANPAQWQGKWGSWLKKLMKNPFVSSQTLASDIATTSGVTLIPRTVRNYLNDAGLRAKAPRTKSFINEVNWVKCLQFAHEYIKKPNEFWESDIHWWE